MKNNSLKFSSLLIAILLPFVAGAQAFLQGEWIGNCVKEMSIEDNNSVILFCALCAVELSEDKSTLKFDQTKLTFNEGMLMILQSGTASHVPYIYNNENWTITYNLEGENNNYKVLSIDNERILLRDDRGRILFLEKK